MNPSGGSRRRRDVTLKALVVLAALAMAALIWGFTLASERAQQRQAQDHAEADVANLALAMEWQLDRQLQYADQAMRHLGALWSADRGARASGTSRDLPIVPGADTLDMLVLNPQGIVVAATRRELVGASFASGRSFTQERDRDAAGLLVTPGVGGKGRGGWRIELSRRLETPDGRFAGAIVATYAPWSLTDMLEQVDLGPRGLIALVGDDGAIRALMSPYPVRPGLDIMATPMFRATRLYPQGMWTGYSAPDGVLRVHAFRRLGNQHLTIVIGVDRDVALHEATRWNRTAWWFAVCITLAVLTSAALAWRAITTGQRRADQLAAGRVRLEQSYACTELARAQAERKTEQLEGVLAGMSDGVMLLDDELRLALWNERFPLYTGVPSELLRVGVPMEEVLRAQARVGEFGPFCSPAALETEVGRRMDRLRSGRVTGAQERMRPGGRSMEFRRCLLPGGGFVTLYTDVTARRQTEAAQAEALRISAEATEQKAGFVAVVSHEIRTPLNAVLGSLALLDESALSDAQRRHADTAREAGNALLDWVNDVLDMARMESGHLELRPAPVDLRRLLAGVEAMFRADAGRRGLHLTIEIAAGLPVLLHADGGRLRQVLVNLVGNALKFATPGAVTIRAAATTAAGTEALLLRVGDAGPRIPEADAALLFRPFSRLGSADRAGTPGSGLGLAISAGLVRLMGGETGIAPSAEGGNEFWLTLPLAPLMVPGPVPGSVPGSVPGLGEVAASAEAAGRCASEVNPWRASRIAVLLVEDVPGSRIVTATLLRRAGHRVDVADSGPAAVREAGSRPYGLVLMDLSMPGMSGYEAARAIRALPGVAGSVPIVALTATTEPEVRALCATAGIDAVLSKPANLTDLGGVMRRFALAARVGATCAVPQAATAGPIDGGRLAELRQNLSPEMLTSLVERCLRDSRHHLQLLCESLAAGNAEQAGAAAHALTGLAATFGMARVVRQARRIIALAIQQGDLEAAATAARGLEPELAAAARILRAGPKLAEA